MNIQLAALTPGEVPGLVVRVLAVVGGAVLFGLLTGFLARLATRMLTTRQMPLWAVRFVRCAGAVVGGWLVALFVFGGGGSGLGGGGGFGLGAGKDTAEKDGQERRKTDQAATTRDTTQSNGAATLVRVTVLSEEALKDITGTTKPDLERRYRIEGGKPNALLTLEEIKTELLNRRKETPDLKVDVVLYEDSLSRGTEQVRRLVDDFLVKEKMFKALDQLSRNAPR